MSDTSGTNYTVTHLGRHNLDTGEHTDMAGNPVESGLDEVVKAELAKMMAPRTATLVGNVADYQVAGARAAADGGNTDAKLPSGTTPLVQTDAQAEPAVAPQDVFSAEERPVVKTEVVSQSEVDQPSAPSPSETQSNPVPSGNEEVPPNAPSESDQPSAAPAPETPAPEAPADTAPAADGGNA